MLKLKEEMKVQQEKRAEELLAQKQKWQKQRAEQMERAAKQAKLTQTKTVTKKMINQRERAGLGKGKVSSERAERRETSLALAQGRAVKLTAFARARTHNRAPRHRHRLPRTITFHSLAKRNAIEGNARLWA